MPGGVTLDDFGRLAVKTGPLPRGNHRHSKGPLSGGRATKKARKAARKSRRANRGGR
jgi:hypothetical protein